MDNQKIVSRKGFSVVQCKAADFCVRAVKNTDHVAQQIENMLDVIQLDQLIRQKFGDKLAKHHVFEIVFSGCPNGCSKPQINDIGIMAKATVNVDCSKCIACMKCVGGCKENALVWDGEQILIAHEQCVGCGDCIKMCPTNAISQVQVGYRIIAGGRLGRHPQLALEIFPFVPEENVVEITKGLIEYFQHYAQKGERLADVIARLGVQSVHEYLQNLGITGNNIN
jgi:dissimilatory sulfite reductase (desulfoviridin) alpha/beta subunit